MNTIKYLFYGVLMGVANVIPGVSGGTMAIILNFYDRLMESITLNFKKIKENLDFLIPLFIGIIAGVFALSNLMGFLLENYVSQTYFGFVGIVLGSLPLILSKAKQGRKIKNISWLPFAIAFGLMVYLAFANGDKESAKTIIKYTSLNFESFIACFIAMAIGTVTMIIPGISGSLILIIIGMYGTIYGYAIPELNIGLLIPVGLGTVFGFFGGAGFVRYLLHHHHQLTYMAIMGLLVGSLVELYNLSGISLNIDFVTISSIITMVVMAIIISWFSSEEIKRDKLKFQE